MELDFLYTAEELAFHDEVRDFTRRELSAETRAKVMRLDELEKRDYVDWQHKLRARGWMGGGWPERFDGAGWTAVQQHLFDVASSAEGAPRPTPFGVTMIGPVLMAFGTPEQQAEHLPRILNSEVWWSQGFSEPGSGSDLASLRTKAVLDGEAYVVSGQKTWTTHAHWGDMLFCLARTNHSVKPQAGISMFLIDMNAPGVEVRPIITLDGAHEVNEVWLDDVRVPKENLVGAEGQGWTIAKFLLEHERTSTAGLGPSWRDLNRLKALLSRDGVHGAGEAFAVYRMQAAEVEMELLALESTLIRYLRSRERPQAHEASVLKLKGTEIEQALSQLTLKVTEALDEPDAHRASLRYLNYRKTTIYGGSSEIQRNIIARSGLRL